MKLNRLLLQSLKQWANQAHRLPLLLRGARQTGKTWLLQELGRECFEHTAYFDFASRPALQEIFSSTRDPQTILKGLNLLSEVPILPGKTLIVSTHIFSLIEKICDRVGVIVRNSNVTEETPEKYILNVYTLGGRQKLSLPFDFEYKYVEADGSDIILYNDDACRVYNYRGHLKFEYTFEQTIESVLPAKGRNTYMLINSQEVQKIRLK